MIKVLLTSMGGPVAPGIINTLREDAKGKIFIIGTDIKDDAIGSKFTDKFFVVPPGNNKNYVFNLKNIIKKEKIEVVVPFSDEEVISLSKNKKELEKSGVKILCNNYQITKKVINKGNLLNFLAKENFPTPEFSLPETEKEIKLFAKKIGYPRKPFVIKPVLGRGGRGFTIVTDEHKFFYEKDRHKLRLEQIIEETRRLKSFPKILMMEYLAGEEYSVDVLADKGKIIYSLPRKRINTTFGPSLQGEFDNNKIVSEIVKRLANILELDLIFNVQLKCRSKKGSFPYIIEINPRAGGTIALNSKAGIPLLFFGIKQALGESFYQKTETKQIRFRRYYQDYYEKF